MDQIQAFEQANYCKLDLDCNKNGGNSMCCFDQKCVKSDTCIVHYYVPLIIAGVLSIGIGVIMSVLINKCLAKQAERIKNELREKRREENIRKQKNEMKKLLGNEGYEQYKKDNPKAFSDKPKDQQQQNQDDLDQYLNKPVQSQQTQQMSQYNKEQHYNFIRAHLLQNPDFQKLPPQQQHQMTLMVMHQQLQQQQYAMQQQQQQFNQMQQNAQQQQRQAPNPITNQSQQLMPKRSQQLIQQSQMQQQQVRTSSNSHVNQQSPLVSQSIGKNSVNDIFSPNSQNVQDSVVIKQPRFFGKQNPNQNMISAQNPLYPDYKPNVPNAGKMEENLIKGSVDADINQKRSILNQVRRGASNQLSMKMQEGPLPSEVKRF